MCYYYPAMTYDAVITGAGPNGLTAAIVLARAGLSVLVREAGPAPGGGVRSAELTLPGFRHDPCSAVHPLAAGSPVFRSMPLDQHGLTWVRPGIPLAQTLADGTAAVISHDLAETASGLGRDSGRYRRLVAPFVGQWDRLAADVLRPQTAGPPRNALLMARFGARAASPASLLVRCFRDQAARTLLAGLAAHVLAPLGSPLTSGTAMMFALAAHEVSWPFPRGGAQALADALAGYLTELGGVIEFNQPVRSMAELPAARAYLFDVAPDALARIAGSHLPRRWLRRLDRYRYGPGAFKVDYALDGPVPWLARECRSAGTVHVAGGVTEIGRSLQAANHGRVPDPPFLITSQPTVFDTTRAPTGKHVFWVYAHVPNGWHGDMVPAIERQLERFAPGFTDRVLARHVAAPAQIEAHNPNNVGGNILVGRCDGLHGVLRPALFSRVPYATANPLIFLCSSATPPGPGVHGMCGYHAARAVLRRVFGQASDAVRQPAARLG